MFKGICHMNREVVTEIAPMMSAGIRKFYIRLSVIGFVVLWVFYLVEALGSDNETRFVMALINIPIMLFFAYFVKRAIKNGYLRVVNQFMGQVEDAYHTDSVEIPMEFRDDMMWMLNAEDERSFYLSDIKNVSETETQIVMQMNNNLYMWIGKDSLEGGSVEEFKTFLTGYINK